MHLNHTCMALIFISLLPLQAQAQMGAPFPFPEGIASRQEMLPDTVSITCLAFSDDPAGAPAGTAAQYFQFVDSLRLLPATPSFFTPENVRNHYFFLLAPGLDTFEIQDIDYSLLRFLRYRAQQEPGAYHLTDSTVDQAGPVQCRSVHFPSPIRVKIMEFGKSWEASAGTYTEFWECSAKADYAPVFPCLRGHDLRGRRFPELIDPEIQPVLYGSQPGFALAVISLEAGRSELRRCRGKRIKTLMRTVQGRPLTGYSIDLNGDRVPDAFWHTQALPAETCRVYTTLYLNVGGEWQARWLTYSEGRF